MKNLPSQALKKITEIKSFFLSLDLGFSLEDFEKIDEMDLVLPFVHKSYIADFHNFKHKYTSNERLEFLGDSVLGLVVAYLLFKDFPQKEESTLSFWKIDLVQAETLAEAINRLDTLFGVKDLILLSKGEKVSGGIMKESILANVFEAIIGFLYLHFGYKKSFEFVKKYLYDSFIQEVVDKPLKNYKTLVQEYFQQRYKKLPQYKITEILFDKSRNYREFKAEIIFDGKVYSEGIGTSKKKAEFDAAKKFFDKYIQLS